jgi:hypothetical protein
MRKAIYAIILVLAASCASAQSSIYINPSIGPYFGTGNPASTAFAGEKWLSMVGYSLEVGYCYKGQVNAGISYGTLDLPNRAPFLQARTGYTFLERPAFSLTIAGGAGYVFRRQQIIGEVDLGANIHLKNDFDLTLYFGNQGVATPTGTSIGYLPSLNIGFSKSFEIKKKR